MAKPEEYDDLRIRRERKALEAWEKPLSMPRAVPKPTGKKKKSRFDKKPIEEE